MIVEKMNFIQEARYRNDTDCLRAIAVMAVIAFHAGYLPKGFLGVDVFFAISGFFITKLIYGQINDGNFSITEFYLGRTRRIIPLTLLVGLVALVAGLGTMLPDDMENLAQSVIATNFFSNNILQAITTMNYWNVVNEYKPLMHTWYLGVIGQYYFLYPLLLILIMKSRPSWLLSILSILGCLSLALYFLPYSADHEKFYLLHFRFWEFAAGGITAIVLKDRLVEFKYSFLLIFFLISLLFINFQFIPKEIILFFTVLLTVGLLATSNKNKLHKFLLENKFLVAIGKISFGLYLWHQVLLAYARYCWVREIHIIHLCAICILTVALTIVSFFLIEKPFSNRNKIQTKTLLLVTGFVLALTTSVSFYIYLNAGVLKDVPELDIRKSTAVRNMHPKYNERIYDYDKKFNAMNKIKVLVIGVSFARDWANVLMESTYADKIEISYIYNPLSHKEFKDRVKEADIIFYSTPTLDRVRMLEIPETKLWVVGTKSFGSNSGIFYNYKGKDYYMQRTSIKKEFLENNDKFKKEWGDKYIDLIGKVIDEKHTVPVFTPTHKFISQDTIHFTKAGAQYFAYLLKNDLGHIFAKVNNKSKEWWGGNQAGRP